MSQLKQIASDVNVPVRPQAGRGPISMQRAVGASFERFSGLYLWALFILIFGIWVPQLFLTTATVQSIASSQAIPAILAIAVLIPLCAGVFDLSVGASTNLCAILVVVLQTTDHVGMWESIVITVAAGCVIGAVNGFLVTKLHIDSFIVTLGTSVVLTAVQGIVSAETQPSPAQGRTWLALTQHQLFGFQVVIVYVVVLALVVWWMLDHTPAGRYIYAIGGNAEAARLSGVRVGKWRWLTLVISGGLCGLAGVLYGSLNGPSLTFGSALLLPAFAAVFLGSTQIRPGRTNIWGTMIAVFLLATGVEGLELVTGVQWLNDMFSGVALIVAVGFAVWRQRRGQQRRRSTRSTPSPGTAPAQDQETPALPGPVRQ
jgi:ribose transport system permease protein